MKLVRIYYKQQTKERIGAVLDGRSVDLNAAAEKFGFPLPSSMMELIRSSETQLHFLQQELSKNDVSKAPECLIEKENIRFLPVVENPEKVICNAFNYPQHAIEYEGEIPTNPVLFNKFPNTFSAHLQDIPLPLNAEKIDYEAELVVVIGNQGKYLNPKQAEQIIFGYTIGNDLSARDIQHQSSQWMLGKNLDYFCPTGPVVVTKDEIPEPNDLQIHLTLNGETRQKDNTKSMILSVEELVSYLSQYLTLQPGDLIFTGSPHGTIGGKQQKDQVWLKS